jgi:hypothetical protein
VKWVIAALAFLTSLVAFVVLTGGGMLLLMVDVSGERGTGALLAFAGAVAFLGAMVLIFAPPGTFRGFGGRSVAVAVGIVAALPVGALSWAALRFAGVPWGNRFPLLDWTSFAVGVLLGLGAASLLVLGYWRMREAGGAGARRPPATRRTAQQQLRTALEHDRDIRMRLGHDEDVRVTRI